jgi:hypothetical protein
MEANAIPKHRDGDQQDGTKSGIDSIGPMNSLGYDLRWLHHEKCKPQHTVFRLCRSEQHNLRTFPRP